MGLDNMPHRYPCATAGTAVRNADERIDCTATIAVGGCPYTRDYEAAGGPAGRVYGMFGTPCWVRGKVGTFILDDLADAGHSPPPNGFYGIDEPGEDQPNLSPDDCRELATWLAEHTEAYLHLLAEQLRSEGAPPERVSEALTDAGQTCHYLAWWLRWVADAGDGADAWW